MKNWLTITLIILCIASMPLFLLPNPVYAQETDSSIVTTLTQDWSSFWSVFNSHVQWNLEYFDGDWISKKYLLQIIRDYPEPNHCKITLNFTSESAGSYRLTFAIDEKVKSYVNKTAQYCYSLKFREYSCTFNWTDIISIPNLDVSHGIKNGYFWFRIKRDNVPVNFNLLIDPSIVATTGTDMYGHGFQRKSFGAEGYFFQFYGNSSLKINYKSSADGSTWGAETYFRDGVASQLSLWYDGSTYVHTVYAVADYGGIIYYRRGDPQNDGTISWDTEQTVYSSTGWLAWEPTIAVDSNNYPYIFTHWEKSTAYNRLVIKSSVNSSGTWTTAGGYPLNLTVFTAEPIPGMIVPLENGKMYAIYSKYEVDTNYYGRLYNGSAWESEETIVAVDYHDIECFSAVSESDNIHMVFPYREIGENARYVKYVNYTSGSWGTAEFVSGELGINDGAIIKALSIEDATTEFYVYCTYLYGTEYVYITDYWHGISGNWGTNIEISWSQNPVGTEMSSFRKNWGNYHSCTVVTYDVDYKLEFWFLSGIAPTISDFEAPTTVYAYQEVMLNCSVNDADGNTTFQNATLTLSVDSLVLKWINSTNTFSMTDPDNKWELVSGTRTSVNSTSYKLTWSVKSYWNSTEGYVSITEAKVYDGDDNYGSNSEGNWFYNENDLIINSANVNDSVVDPSTALTFTGQIYYQGTSTAPYTTNGITAKIELSATLKGSNSSIASDGSFTIGFNAETSFANHSYNVYSTTVKNSIQNKTVYVVVERVNVTITANTTTPWADETVNFTLTALYEVHGTTVTSWTVNTNRNGTHFASGNFTDMQTTPIVYEYTTENITETNYGLSTFTSNTVTVTWRTTYFLNLQTRDWEGNILTSATVYMNNGTQYSKVVDSNGWANWTHINSTTVDVYATWYGYTVNSTFQISMGADRTSNVTCKCYPLVLDSTRYWIAGNASVNTYSWNDTTNKFVLTFTGSADNYTLVSSTTSYPTYILNATYDIDTDWTTYLTLSHYGNRTITIAYPNWVSTRIYRTDDFITNAYWASEGEKLLVVLSGTSENSGSLEIYCGSRGTPQSTTGLTDTVYFSATTILAGTYTFSSTVTAEIDWTITGGGGGGGSVAPSIFATAPNIELGAIQQGTSKTFNATATWTGSASITLADVSLSGVGSEWLKIKVSTPLIVHRLAVETSGTIQVPIVLSLPRDAKLGDYKVLIEYQIQVGANTYETTAQIVFSVISTPIPPIGLPNIVSMLLFVALISIPLLVLFKRSSKK